MNSNGNYVPGGSYALTCKNIKVTLTCQAQNVQGAYVPAGLDLTTLSNVDVANMNGMLEVQGSAPASGYVPTGSYLLTSTGITVTLTCSAQQLNGQWVDASLDITSLQNADIANINGVLVNEAVTGISAVFTEIYDGGSAQANTPQTPYDKFDVLYVAFAHINQQTFMLDFEDVSDGGKAAEKARLNNILSLVQTLRATGKIKVVISLGWGATFNDIPLIEENLAVFAPSVKAFLQANNLDGFDIDYETPQFSSSESFQQVSAAIRAALGNEYLFTITPNNTSYLDGPTLSKYYDYVNVQSYDAPNDAYCAITEFTTMPGMDLSKLLAGADTDGNPTDYQNAINNYNEYKIKGVFAWKLEANFDTIADAMWNATHPSSATA